MIIINSVVYTSAHTVRCVKSPSKRLCVSSFICSVCIYVYMTGLFLKKEENPPINNIIYIYIVGAVALSDRPIADRPSICRPACSLYIVGGERGIRKTHHPHHSHPGAARGSRA